MPKGMGRNKTKPKKASSGDKKRATAIKRAEKTSSYQKIGKSLGVKRGNNTAKTRFGRYADSKNTAHGESWVMKTSSSARTGTQSTGARPSSQRRTKG